jgi:uncharacterized membrane protein
MMIEIIPNWHPLLVHFTIALFATSTLLFYCAVIVKNKSYAITILKTAHINLWLGAIITPLTLLAGWDAYNTVNHDAPSHMAMTDHRNWAVVTASLWFLIAIWAGINARKTLHHGVIFYTIITIATIMLGITGLKGGEVVYRHGTGVMRIPIVIGNGGHDSHSHEGASVHGTMPRNDEKVPEIEPKNSQDKHSHGH